MPKIVILGAGVAGLAAAVTLKRAGETDILVLEREDYTGGLAHSFSWEGCTLDYGPHRFFTQIPRVERFVHELVGDQLVETDRHSQMVLLGKRINYPVRLKQVLATLGPVRAAGLLVSYGFRHLSPAVSELPPDSYGGYVARQFGMSLYELLFRGYASKVWQERSEDLDAAVAKVRLASGSLWDTIKEVLRGEPKHTVKRFVYPREGIGMIPRLMADEITAAGAGILHNAEPTRITLGPAGRKTLRVRRNGTEETVECESLITTIPLSSFLGLLDPAPSAEVLQAGRELIHSEIRFVYLKVDKPRVTENSWMYFPDPNLRITRLYEVGNFHRCLVPEGQTCLAVEIPCRRDQEVWTWPEEQLVSRVIEDLRRCGLIHGEEIVAARALSLAEAYPVYRYRFRGFFEKVVRYMASLPGVFTTGRNGLFCYNNTDQSIEMGFVTGECLLEEPGGTGLYYERIREFDRFRIVD